MTEQQARPTVPVCDFCEAPNALFAYPVAAITVGGDVMVAGEEMVSDEETIPAAFWTTCTDCHRLIEAQDWDALTIHAGYPPGFAPTPVTAFRDHQRGGATLLKAE
jgi:hypothetical protein